MSQRTQHFGFAHALDARRNFLGEIGTCLIVTYATHPPPSFSHRQVLAVCQMFPSSFVPPTDVKFKDHGTKHNSALKIACYANVVVGVDGRVGGWMGGWLVVLAGGVCWCGGVDGSSVCPCDLSSSLRPVCMGG